ncbi:MAG: transposase [Acidiferrobacteraceae bacterium]
MSPLQRGDLQGFPSAPAAPADARTPHDRRTRQCSISSRKVPGRLSASPCSAQLRLLFLPPYSPPLAPIESVWKLARHLATHNRYFATLPEVLKAVSACFDRWRRPNKVLHRLCCIT